MARNRNKKLMPARAVTPQQAQRLQRQVQQSLKLAVRHHAAGRLAKAEGLYNQVLQADPDNPDALHLLGVVAHQEGDNERAVALISQALEHRPEFADAHSNLGNALRELGRMEEALASYYRAIALMPDLAEAHNNVGTALKALGRPEDSLENYHMAVALRPDYAEAYNNYGDALQELRRLEEALACYQRAIALRPTYAEAYNNMGSALRELGRLEDAIESYQQALKLDPEDPSTQANLAGLYISKLDDPGLAIAESNKGLTLLRRSTFGAACDDAAVATLMKTGMPYFRLKHDVQQADYLAAQGHAVAGLDTFRQAGRALLDRSESAAEGVDAASPTLRPTRDEAAAMLPYLQAGHEIDLPEIAGGCLNCETEWKEVETRYLESKNEIIHVDNLLSPAALAAFQTFSLASKVWLKDYPNKYLGAFSDRGFISPLHFQLARELQEMMPRVFGGHPLGRFWAFKYDATLGKGINVHADFALVNLNFWITPDEYNLDPESGGLVVYDVPSPRNWHFKAYNENKDAIYQFLKDNKADSVSVPHRCNRAVLFNSAYFHETDEIHFAEGYESRRINITYLFGKR